MGNSAETAQLHRTSGQRGRCLAACGAATTGGLNLADLEGSAMSQDAPSHAGELVGERDGKDVVICLFSSATLLRGNTARKKTRGRKRMIY
jgi:hypothetical protein